MPVNTALNDSGRGEMVNPFHEKMKTFLKSLSGLDESQKKVRFEELRRKEPRVHTRLLALMDVARKAEDAAGLRASDGDLEHAIRRASNTPRVQKLAGTLSQLGGTHRHQLLDRLERVSPGLADAIQRAMFAFEDLQYGDPKGMQRLLAHVERKSLLRALRLTSDDVTDKILSHVSQRVAADLREELTVMAPVRRADALDAQSSIVSHAKAMIEAGTLTVIKPAQRDDWVD